MLTPESAGGATFPRLLHAQVLALEGALMTKRDGALDCGRFWNWFPL